MEVYIRKAKRGDEPKIWKAHTRAISEVSARDYPQNVVEELLSPTPMENVEAVAAHHFVAEADGLLVGYGAIDVENCEIQSLVVDPD